MIKKHYQSKDLEKGAHLTKGELKKRLLKLGAKLDPIDDNKKTYEHLYDSIIKLTSHKNMPIIVEEDETILEPKLLSSKRIRTAKKRDISSKKSTTTSKRSRKRSKKTPSRGRSKVTSSSRKVAAKSKSVSQPKIPPRSARKKTTSVVRKAEVKQPSRSQNKVTRKTPEKPISKEKNIAVKIPKTNQSTDRKKQRKEINIGLIPQVKEINIRAKRQGREETKLIPDIKTTTFRSNINNSTLPKAAIPNENEIEMYKENLFRNTADEVKYEKIAENLFIQKTTNYQSDYLEMDRLNTDSRRNDNQQCESSANIVNPFTNPTQSTNNILLKLPWMTQETLDNNILRDSNRNLDVISGYNKSPSISNIKREPSQDNIIILNSNNNELNLNNDGNNGGNNGDVVNQFDTYNLKNANQDEVKSYWFNGKVLFKYMLIGGSILAIKYSITYFMENPEKLEAILENYKLFNGLDVQFQILIVFVFITLIFFVIEKTYVSVSNNNKANYVFNLIKESLISDTSLQVFDDDIITIYSNELKVNQDYFKENILPEIKRLGYVDRSISVTRQRFFDEQNNECEVDVWKCFQ